ncbi:MAG: peptidase M28, partial [Alistipes sp.]|nr:peptidase M28 [Alistipes sp.]
MKKLILFALLVLPLGVWAQSAAVKKIMEMSREDNRVMEHLDVLCNRFGGRLVGSAGFENSQAWIVKQLEDWGLEVTLEKAGEVPVGFNRGGWWGRAMGEYSETLYFTTPSYTAGTKGKQRGHVVIEPRTQDQFNRMKGTLKGAWVLMESKSTGWPLEHSAEAREARKAAIAENAEIAQ